MPTPISAKRKPVNTKVEPALWLRMRHLALTQGVSVRDVLEHAIRDYLEKEEKTSA